MELKINDREVFLQDVWKNRRLCCGYLETISGKSVEVLYAGTQNHDSGPDFKDAVLKVGGTLLKGDIELHLEDRGWYEHQHHNDSAYNNVILHVVSERIDNRIHVEREDRALVEQVVVPLNPDSVLFFKHREESIEHQKAKMVFVENCPLSAQDLEQINHIVDAAGEHRLLNKAEQLGEELVQDDWDQLLYRKVMEALGYSKNQEPFRKLANLVPFELLRAEMQWTNEAVAELRVTALLFGAAGLLPKSEKLQAGLCNETVNYVQPLLDLWEGMSRRLELKPMHPEDWLFFRLRPQNFPTRRLAGLVQTLMKCRKQGFFEWILTVVNGHQGRFKLMIKEFERYFTQSGHAYWANHYHFGESGREKPLQKDTPLIGKERARDIVVNILLPAMFLYGKVTESGTILNAALELYRQYPKHATNILTRKMETQLSQTKAVSYKSKSALQQQGLIHLNKVYCRRLRCVECFELEMNPSA